MPTQADAPIKGSWEALLQQANEYASSYNDGAIPVYEKIYNRLQKVPRVQRQAANQRLQNIYMQAAVNLHAYLIMRERYDEGLAIIPVLQDEMDADEITRWEIHAAHLLVQQGRQDDAVARLTAVAEKAESDLDVWGELASVLLQLRRHDEADAVIERMDAWVAEHHDTETDAQRRDAGAVASLRASGALRRKEWTDAAHWLDVAVEFDQEYEARRMLLAIELIRAGEFKMGDRFLAKAHQDAVRTKFWRGYSLWRQGEAERADALWEDVTEADLEEDTSMISEYVLASYYLGDKSTTGLSTVLGILSEDASQHWGIYFLAGLGWAIRGNAQSAKADMETAMLQRRAGGEGRHLPYSAWLYVTDLTDAAMQQQLARYFETSEP